MNGYVRRFDGIYGWMPAEWAEWNHAACVGLALTRFYESRGGR